MNKKSTFILYLLTNVLIFCYNQNCAAKCHPYDWTALKALYGSTDGDNWNENDGWELLNMDTIPTICNLKLLYGIDLNSHGRVSRIDLDSNNLKGIIPPEIGLLTELNILYLAENNLEGIIPPELGNLYKLKYLYLFSNQLNESIPPELGNLTNLLQLHLSYNSLSGFIPSELGKLIQLEYLSLDNNKLKGFIPNEIGKLNNLVGLDLKTNRLMGLIPHELGSLSQLEYLNVASNKLTGCLYSNLAKLCDSTRVSIQDNLITENWNDFCSSDENGCPPCYIDDWNGLKALYRSTSGDSWFNSRGWEIFKDSIPPINCNLDTIYGIDLNDNGRVKSIKLGSNNLDGHLPSELGNLIDLKYLHLNNNTLGDTISSLIGNLRKLDELYLDKNQFSEIHANLSNLNNLKELGLSNNQLSGSFPSWIGNLNINDLNINNNKLDGCYESDLLNLCTQLNSPNFRGNADISDDNDFDNSWTEFCDYETGICQNRSTCDSFTYYSNLSCNDSTGIATLIYSFTGNSDADTFSVSGDTLLMAESGIKYSVEYSVGSHSYKIIAKDNFACTDTITGTFMCDCVIEGCINESACNYKPTACIDDNSCDFGNTLCIVPCDPTSECPIQEVEGGNPPINCNIDDWTALKALYENTFGTSWRNRGGWDVMIHGNSTPPANCNLDDLYGVGIDNDGRVNNLSLQDNRLGGSIPVELSKLSNLTQLYLYFNRLSGEIPPELGFLTKLEKINLSTNDLRGNIPKELFNLVNLSELVLGSNQLSGSIPQEVGNLTKLETLVLKENGISGSIPQEFSNLSKLSYLDLSVNRFTGNILLSLQKLSELEVLWLNNNEFEGNIPSFIGELSNLIWLRIYNNNLSGCYENNLKILCTQLDSTWPSSRISEGNNFNATWEEFCTNDAGNCNNCVFGCTIEGSCNYNPNATCNDGNCDSGNLTCSNPCDPDVGCTEPTACNYDPDACEDDGSCTFGTMGCTDPCNPVFGCTEPSSCSFVPEACVNDGSCVPAGTEIFGCMNTEACNYDVSANCDDGSCFVGNFECSDPCNPIFGCTNPASCTYEPEACEDDGSCVTVGTEVFGCTDPMAINHNPEANCDDGSCYYEIFDLSLRMGLPTNQPTTFNAGDMVTYEITIHNDGTLTAQNITISDNFPDDLILNDSNWEVMDSNAYTTVPRPLAPGAGLTVNITFQISNASSGAINNQARITSAEDGMGKVYTGFMTSFDSVEIMVMNSCHQDDWTALKALYQSTNGADWKNNTGWEIFEGDQNPPPNCNLGQLFGVSVNENGRVEGLVLFNNNLVGTLPVEIGSLNDLKVFSLYNNGLIGNIPAEIGNLNLLELIWLQNNNLDGSLPASLGNLVELKEIRIFNNQLSGNIPAELGNLVNLETLSLSGNQLSGTIPPELGNMLNLVQLGLNTNRLTGAIPPELGNLSNLESLALYKNQLTGTIPNELSNLVKLRGLYLWENQLTGSVPTEIGKLQNLKYLYLQSNSLSGCFDQTLLNLCNLDSTDFRFNNNNFDTNWEVFCKTNGAICEQGAYCNEADWNALKELYSNTNGDSWINNSGWDIFENDTPPEDCDLRELYGVTLNDEGRVATILLNNNRLDGTIPEEINLLNGLTELDISNNRISGNLLFSNVNDIPVNISSNEFSFSEIKAYLEANLNQTSIDYSPQYFGISTAITENLNNSTNLFVPNLPQVPNPSYQWVQNESPIEGENNMNYQINSIDSIDVGSYTLEVKDDDNVKDLVLISRPIDLYVENYDIDFNPIYGPKDTSIIAEVIYYGDIDSLVTAQPFEYEIVDSCGCDRKITLLEFESEDEANSFIVEVNSDDEKEYIRADVDDDGVRNYTFGHPIIANPDSTVAVYKVNSTVDTEIGYAITPRIFIPDTGLGYHGNELTSAFLMKNAPIDSCYHNLLPTEGFNYIGPSVTRNFGDDLGHGTFGFNTMVKNLYGRVDLEVIPIRIFDEYGSGSLFDMICAIYHAADHGANLICLSSGYKGEESQALKDAIAYAKEQNVIIVTAAGNDGLNIDLEENHQYPAVYSKDYDNVITVASLDTANQLSSFSNYGKQMVTLSAFGENVEGYTINKNCVAASGTSIAAFLVARGIAVEWAKGTHNDYLEVIKSFYDSALMFSSNLVDSTKTEEFLPVNPQRVKRKDACCQSPIVDINVQVTCECATFNVSLAEGKSQFFYQYKEESSETWLYGTGIEGEFVLEELQAELDYEIMFRTICDGDEYSSWTESIVFTTKAIVDSCYCVIPNVNEEPKNQATIRLYPNPVEEVITLEIDNYFNLLGNQAFNIRISDLTGRTIYISKNVNATNHIKYTINTFKFQKGLHLISVFNDKKNIIKKIIIK